MALTNIEERKVKKDFEEGSYKKLFDLAQGESISGYITAFKESSQVEGALNIIMLVDGVSTYVATAGNVKWAVKDGKLIPGQFTRFTRQEDTKVKGKKSSSYLIEQDADDTIEVEEPQAPRAAAAPAGKANTSVADKIKAMKEGRTNAAS